MIITVYFNPSMCPSRDKRSRMLAGFNSFATTTWHRSAEPVDFRVAEEGMAFNTPTHCFHEPERVKNLARDYFLRKWDLNPSVVRVMPSTHDEFQKYPPEQWVLGHRHNFLTADISPEDFTIVMDGHRTVSFKFLLHDLLDLDTLREAHSKLHSRLSASGMTMAARNIRTVFNAAAFIVGVVPSTELWSEIKQIFVDALRSDPAWKTAERIVYYTRHPVLDVGWSCPRTIYPVELAN